MFILCLRVNSAILSGFSCLVWFFLVFFLFFQGQQNTPAFWSFELVLLMLKIGFSSCQF